MKEKLKKYKVELPPLCCCGDTFWDSHPDTCANNCIFYNNPKGKLLTLCPIYLKFQDNRVFCFPFNENDWNVLLHCVLCNSCVSICSNKQQVTTSYWLPGSYFCGIVWDGPAHRETSLVKNPAPRNCRPNFKNVAGNLSRRACFYVVNVLTHSTMT